MADSVVVCNVAIDSVTDNVVVDSVMDCVG